MRKSAVVVSSLAWFAAIGGTFGALLPYLLNDWQFHQPLPGWIIARVAGGLLIGLGLVPIVSSFAEFARAEGTPIPVASPPRLVVRGCYRYVRNPIYVGFLVVLLGETLLFGSPGLLEYTLVACGVAAVAVRWYEEPRLLRRFGAEYRAYQRGVPAWRPRLHAWGPEPPSGRASAGEQGRAEE
jgi:protein-S-isoprenylcysteine O-methyltransferase Ste14